MITSDDMPTAAAGTRDKPAGPAGAGCYVYGIVPASGTDPKAEKLPAVGGDDQAQVSWVRHGDIAAVVSPLRDSRPLGKPDDLRAHANILDTLAATGTPVLPFRFGTVLEDEQAVADDVLAPGRDSFTRALERLSGRTQFTLRAAYHEDALLREVLAERPDIAELRESTSSLPEEAARYERVRLGELVFESIEARRAKDSAEIQQRLGPFADAMVVSQAPGDDGVVDIAFLVSDDRRAEFERTADRLAGGWHGRIHVRLLGPLAPYDFVAEAMEEPEGAP
jgi:hypothetical protein